IFERDHEQVPLLVAVVIGLEDDPSAVRRPLAGHLPLVGDGELQRPTAFGRYDPEIVAPAGVIGEADPFAVRRPPPAADGAGAVKAVERNAGNVRALLAEYGGIH